MSTLHLRTYLCSLGFEKSPHQLPRRGWREGTRELKGSGMEERARGR